MSAPLSLAAHGGQLLQIASRFGIPAERLSDFSANINPAGPPAPVLEAIRRALEDPTTLTTYPDLELTELKQAISACIGAASENIAVANGFAPLLDAALRSLGIRRCLLPVPSFSEYRSGLEKAGVAVIPFHLSQKNGFEYENDPIRTALHDHSCDAILLANPQNPSGVTCDAEKMRELIAMAARHNVTVLLDEAFIDYCPVASVTPLAIDNANLIVFRSVTKFFAVPGLRVAYAAAESSKIQTMSRYIAPWPIANIASIAVCAALQDRAYAEESRLANDRRHFWLVEQLAQLQIATYPSRANFLLLRFPAAVNVSALWERMIVDEQIVLRSCTNFEGLRAEHLRIAVRSGSENERLIRGLERAMAKGFIPSRKHI
ncbi:MAG: aminotransferase class I/II-fold pyridoxal phosphate-dependent enzyme [Edaphobacter sp.]